MNLKQLEVLKAIVATGSTVGASTILGISQSAISRHLTGLEAEIGFELFIRDKGRLIPRPEAKALVPEVEELTEVLARVRRKAADIKAGSSGDTLLRVAFPHSITTTLLPKVLSQYFEIHPTAVVETLSGPYGAIEQMIQEGRATTDGQPVHVVMLTHACRDANVKSALREIQILSGIAQPARAIRIEEG